jgi:hypothetical protein
MSDPKSLYDVIAKEIAMRTLRIARTARSLVLLSLLLICSGALAPLAPKIVFAAPVTYSAAGANAAAIQSVRDQFRADLGGGTVAGANGSFGGLRREINWDGVPDNRAAPNNLPPDFFNTASPRGVLFSTPGTGLQVSASAASGVPTLFGNLNPNYASTFITFSPQRLFAPLGSNIVDVTFFVPGTNTPATVSGFGAIFTDIDSAGATTIEYFDQGDNSLGVYTPPAANAGLTFFGVLFNAGERVARVRITSGEVALGPDDGPSLDVVAMDDFIYSEPQNPAIIFALTTSNTLLRFSSVTPNTIAGTVAVGGLQAGETLLGIDFRPSTGQLYGLGSTSRLYTIDPATGAATQVGSGPFSPPLSGTEFGFDVNPIVDRIRVVSDADQNLRLNPTTGAIAATDTALSYSPGDPNAGQNPNVVGAAYTNNVPVTTTTTLYAIDSNLDILLIQNPPNNGALNTVGVLGVDTSGLVGFDIAADGTVFASLTVGGVARLYMINLATGAATPIGPIGNGAPVIRDTAVAPGGVLQFSAASYTVTENASAATITVSRSSGSFGAVAVSFASSDGTATSGADYTPATGVLLFGDSEISKTFNVSIIDDAAHEPDETIVLRLSAPMSAVLGATNPVTLTIADNDTILYLPLAVK